MNFFLIDDDVNIINILKLIIESRSLGTIIGYSTNGIDGLEDIKTLTPDIVIVDLLMPLMDGISLVQKCKEENLDINFIMLSQVSSKDIIGKAYEAGIEFFIQKPINAIEVENVIDKVSKSISINRTFYKMQNLFIKEISTNINDSTPQTEELSKENNFMLKLQAVLQKLGIMGELGSKDILTLVEYLIKTNQSVYDFTLNKLCKKFTDSPKSMEQRIRRAANAGMVNLANLGLEDYMNDSFNEYSNTLYNFEQVKKEMDFIRGKISAGGKTNIKKFLNALMFYSKD
ncbi:response regulator [Clostridium senegalense]|uniref:response regulator n=1 Tax=Clostridium senegalense TaxID=1465809 RepID=UPI001C111118|nr:response regulator [Clostridium senegalense]MBU5225700.1 response regulator [Clostridium senegalense]